MSILSELQKLNEVGHALGWIRTTCNLTIEQVADAADIGRQYLRDIEAQSVPITPALAAVISATLMDLQAGKVRLHCHECASYVASVHAPAPPVPVTCSACRNAR